MRRFSLASNVYKIEGGELSSWSEGAMKMLVAGGDTDLFQKLKSCLESLSGDIEHAETPRDCLASLRSDDVDIVILVDDLVNENPGQAIGRIRSTAPRSSIVYLSQENDEETARRLIRFGASDVVFMDELEEGTLMRTIGRVAERSVTSVQIISQISDFVLTHSFDGIVALDLQNRIILWNHAMERMFGKKRQDVIGKVANEELPFEGLEREISFAVAGRSFAGEKKSYLSRGERRFYQPYYSPLRNRSGVIIGVMANFRDLTDTFEKDRMLVDLSERVQHLANTAQQMVWMAGVDGTRNFFNRRWLEFTGTNEEALKFDGWLVGIHPQDRARFQAVYERAVSERSPFHVEYRMRRNDKKYRRLLDSGTPLIASDGAFLGFIGSCTDISESGTTQHKIDTASVLKAMTASGQFAAWREHTPSAVPAVASSPTGAPAGLVGSFNRLRESGMHAAYTQDVADEREQSTTMENAPIGVWKLDLNLIITKVSRAVADQLGIEPEDLVGKHLHDVVPNVPPDLFERVLTRNENVQISGQKIEMKDKPEPKTIWVDLAAWPLKDKHNEVTGICISTMAVDDRVSVDKQREDFIATLVHDLKTPLIGADRALELIINGTLGDIDDSQSEVLQMLKRSNQGLLRMVQNLIEVYRYDFRKPDLAFELVSLFDLAGECARELMALAEQRNIALHVNLAPSQGEVQVDALAIRRVILNLMDNAIKFTTSGGTIKVWGEETPNQITLCVKDTGIGIAHDELDKVFDRFWRSDRGKGQAVGTGLGLYLCKQIIDAHRGEITVTSTEGEGTTFSIMLPRR